MEVLRSKPYASTFFRAKNGPSTVLSEIPRYRYMFYARFVASSDALARYPQYRNLGNWEDGISFKIHSIDKPKVELKDQELNQYNRKRFVYTKAEYSPITLNIYDTHDDRPLKLWYNYFTYYFGDSRPKGQSQVQRDTTYNQSVVGNPFDYSTGWGLNPQGERLNFFDRIELYAIFGGRFTQINYINPKITNVDWQKYESSGTDPAEFSMTLRYEAIEYAGFAQVITEDYARMFGFDIEPPTEIAGMGAPAFGIESWVPRSDIYSLLNTIQTGLAITTDISQGLSRTFAVANSTLNLFNPSTMNAYSSNPGMVIAQVNSTIAAVNTLASVGTSTLSSFGKFNFGSSDSFGGLF